MSDDQAPVPKRPRLGDDLQERLHKTRDSASLCAQREWSKYFYIERLLSFASKLCEKRSRDCTSACKYYRRNAPSIFHARKRPKLSVVEFLIDHEDAVLVYLAKFCESFPEETASTYELLEASWFDRSPLPDTAVRKKLPSGPRLEYFRMSQQIRDQHGITPAHCSSQCFSSFEDIARMEETLAEDNPVEFMAQCVALTKDEHASLAFVSMYSLTETLSQLTSFHREVSRLGKLDEKCKYLFGEQFRFLIQYRSSAPTWSQVKMYLQEAPFLCPQMKTLFDVDIPREQIDEAFRGTMNYFLRYFARTSEQYIQVGADFGNFREDVRTAVVALKWLLDKGARLWFREPHEFLHCEQSSLGALIELAILVPTFPLMEFFAYICCPLAAVRGELGLDANRIVPLSCLAAMRVGPLERYPRVPNKLRLLIRMHQDLQSQLSRKVLWIAVARRRVLGDLYPVDDASPIELILFSYLLNRRRAIHVLY